MDLSLCTVDELWNELQSRTVCAIFAAELTGNDPNGCEVAIFWKGSIHNALGLCELHKTRMKHTYLSDKDDEQESDE